jgi:hypothetical protein
MNQRGDSLKKNLQPNVAKPRFNRCGGLLSHTLTQHRGERRENRIESGTCGTVVRDLRCTARRRNAAALSRSGSFRSRRRTSAQSRSIVVPSGLPLSRSFRPDAHRPSSGDGSKLGFRFNESATSWAELRSIPDHACRDTLDIGDIGTANAKRIAAARLLLLLRVSLPCRGPDEDREHCAEYQAELDIP